MSPRVPRVIFTQRKNIVAVETQHICRGEIVEFFLHEPDLRKEKPSDKITILGLRAVVLSGVSDENFHLTVVDDNAVLLREVPFACLKPREGSAWIFAVPVLVKDCLQVQVRSLALSDEGVRLTFYGIGTKERE